MTTLTEVRMSNDLRAEFFVSVSENSFTDFEGYPYYGVPTPITKDFLFKALDQRARATATRLQESLEDIIPDWQGAVTVEFGKVRTCEEDDFGRSPKYAMECAIEVAPAFDTPVVRDRLERIRRGHWPHQLEENMTAKQEALEQEISAQEDHIAELKVELEELLALDDRWTGNTTMICYDGYKWHTVWEKEVKRHHSRIVDITVKVGRGSPTRLRMSLAATQWLQEALARALQEPDDDAD